MEGGLIRLHQEFLLESAAQNTRLLSGDLKAGDLTYFHSL